MNSDLSWMKQRYPVPEGKSGDWSVKQFTVSEEAAAAGKLRAMMNRSAMRRWVPAGTYTGIYRGGAIIMSDTPDEIRDLSELYFNASGDVLINGLGLGVAARIALAKPKVTSVTVVEKSTDVIALVAPHIEHPKLTVINADAFAWAPPRGARYAAAWHDIWDDISGDNLPEMKQLHRKYAKRADWQGSWCRDLCKAQRW